MENSMQTPTLQSSEGVTVPELSYGQKLVGLTFNTSGDSRVTEAKQLSARLADLLNENYVNLGESKSALAETLYNHSIGEILNAQMSVVKLLTLKNTKTMSTYQDQPTRLQAPIPESTKDALFTMLHMSFLQEFDQMSNILHDISSAVARINQVPLDKENSLAPTCEPGDFLQAMHLQKERLFKLNDQARGILTRLNQIV